MFRVVMRVGVCAILTTGAATAAAPSVEIEWSGQTALTEIVGAVLQENPVLAGAEARLEAARARAGGSRLWRYNPELEYERENAQDRTETIGISQTIEWFSKPDARGRVADRRVEGLIAEVDVVRQRLVAGVLSGFALVDQRRALFELASRRVEDASRFADLSERLFQEGDISPSTVQAARLAATQAVMAQQSARIDQSQAEQELAEITGNFIVAWPKFAAILPEPLAIAQIDTDQLPSVVAARYRREAADGDVSVARWNRVPDPSVGVTWGEEGGTDLFGVRISIPIPVLNSGRAEVAAARADAVSAAAELSATRRSASLRLRERARRYDALRASQVLWQKDGVEALARQAYLLERRLSGGDIGAVSYLVQVQQLYDTEAASIDLHGQAWVSWFQFLEAAGVIEKWIGIEK